MTNLSIIGSSLTNDDDDKISMKVVVISGYIFHVFQNEFFPFPLKKDTVLQPENAWNISKAKHLLSPR